MVKGQQETRRDLRERALQTLIGLEFQEDSLGLVAFAYNYDKEEVEEEREVPVFLLNLVQGVQNHQADLDQKIAAKLKAGWTVDRLTLIEKNILRLGLFEMLYFEETPAVVAVNEAVELAKTFSEPKSAGFVNGVLSAYVVDEADA
ncbi:transcription antitermination factor NusB [Streptococcus danieliae]|uniref:Transcription antitermination protein NusB n=1 Tax=Streptococcus danieliae TaxID=747656 RepID=A0A7Z0S6F7_9STRE|nr:transcription antitermination factor NusB [Streptococcus danieliae]MBF0699519.1 transcription antitermination factor NusB [Streptococcus danieliae]NYS96695.1 transcription antitermination factor NusB [Streptococcus danieliae]